MKITPIQAMKNDILQHIPMDIIVLMKLVSMQIKLRKLPKVGFLSNQFNYPDISKNSKLISAI